MIISTWKDWCILTENVKKIHVFRKLGSIHKLTELFPWKLSMFCWKQYSVNTFSMSGSVCQSMINLSKCQKKKNDCRYKFKNIDVSEKLDVAKTSVIFHRCRKHRSSTWKNGHRCYLNQKLKFCYLQSLKKTTTGLLQNFIQSHMKY